MITNLDSFSWIVLNGLVAAFSLVCFFTILVTKVLVPNLQNTKTLNHKNKKTEEIYSSTITMIFSFAIFVIFLIFHLLAIKGILTSKICTDIFSMALPMWIVLIFGRYKITAEEKKQKNDVHGQ